MGVQRQACNSVQQEALAQGGAPPGAACGGGSSGGGEGLNQGQVGSTRVDWSMNHNVNACVGGGAVKQQSQAAPA